MVKIKSLKDGHMSTRFFLKLWTNYWFTWSGTGNFTGERLVIKGHFDYEWKDGKIVQALGFFADEQFNKEYAAAMAASE